MGFEWRVFLLDDQLTPWLLEVNADPQLGTDTPVDLLTKPPMLVDALNVIGLPKPPSPEDTAVDAPLAERLEKRRRTATPGGVIKISVSP